MSGTPFLLFSLISLRESYGLGEALPLSPPFLWFASLFLSSNDSRLAPPFPHLPHRTLRRLRLQSTGSWTCFSVTERYVKGLRASVSFFSPFFLLSFPSSLQCWNENPSFFTFVLFLWFPWASFLLLFSFGGLFPLSSPFSLVFPVHLSVILYAKRTTQSSLSPILIRLPA